VREENVSKPKPISIKPKPVLKATKMTDPVPTKPDARSISPPVKKSKPVRNKLTEEDEEIAALEKKLGLKGKKKRLADAGFDDLLGDLEAEEDSDAQDYKKRKAEGDEWLDRKRAEARKNRGLPAKFDEEDEDEGGSSGEDHLYSEDDDGASDVSLDGPEFPDDESNDDSNGPGDDGMVLDAEDDDFEEFDSDDADEDEQPGLPRVRENPYVAPVANGEAPQMYIPPSLRKPAASDSEALVRLRRQTQGLVNRLTESNLISIVGDIEKLYRDHPRQHVTSTLVDLLLTSVCEPTSLPDTLIILPAGFIAAVYKLIGMDFGAQIVQRAVELFDEHYSRSATDLAGPAAAPSSSSKETSNLIMLLSEMYNFQVIGSNLLFDYIRLFLEKLSELHAELLLKIIRTSGPQLRRDDPSSLKDIVAMLRPAVASVGGEEKLSVRTKFMIETINDLKNNKMKTGGAASAVTSEHTVRMKKTLGTLNTRNIKAHEPLRIGLKDIKDSDKKGKWWLVGASWTGSTAEDSRMDDRSRVAPMSHSSSAQVDNSPTSDLVQLAREQGMNTDIRIAIFIAIMDASDYKDAHLRLMNLRLKKVQEYEVPTVLVHCVGSEKTYNPYYALVAKRICGDRKLKTSFQFCLWDIFKKLGESNDDDSEVIEDENMDTRRIVNLAKMFGKLIGGGSLSLSVLRKLNLSYLQPKTKIFMEVVFITIFLESQRESKSKRDEQSVVKILESVKETPQLITGLMYFLKKVVRKTDIAGGKKENATVHWACKIARDTLESFVATDQ
jgi:nucleolar MIF4G domain-containing protein 1